MSVLELLLKMLQLDRLKAAAAPPELRTVVVTDGSARLQLVVRVRVDAAGGVAELQAGLEGGGAAEGVLGEEAGDEAGVGLTLPELGSRRAETVAPGEAVRRIERVT